MAFISGFHAKSFESSQTRQSGRAYWVAPWNAHAWLSTKTATTAASTPAAAAASSVATLSADASPLRITQPLSLDRGPPSNEGQQPGFSLPSATIADAAVSGLLFEGKEQTMQQLSLEMSRLMVEVEAELGAFLTARGPLPQPPVTSSPVAPQPAPQQALPQALAAVVRPSLPSIPLPEPPSAPPLNTRLASLSLLAPPGSTRTRSAPALGSAKDRARKAAAAAAAGTAATAGAVAGAAARTGQEEADAGAEAKGAGSRAERRRAKWGRMGPAVVEEPVQEAKYKAMGKNSLGMFMGRFSKDHILSAEEERLLAEASQDLCRVEEVKGLLNWMFKRPPNLSELAAVLSCEESALRTRMECGTRARTILAQKNYRLVVSIAKYVVRLAMGAAASSGSGTAGGSTEGGGGSSMGGADSPGGALLLADAVTSGMQGLMKAVTKFKPDAGCRFSTYATWWIRQSISRSVRAQALVISAPSSKREVADRVARVRSKLEAELQRRARPEEVAAAAGVAAGRVEELEYMRRALWLSRSLEGPVAEGSDRSMADLVVSQDPDDVPSPEGNGSSLAVDSEAHYALSSELEDTFESLLEGLGPKDETEVRRMLGVDSVVSMPESEDTIAETSWRRRRRGELEAEAEVLGASVGGGGGVVPGGLRLKLESPSHSYYSSQRALRKLQDRIAADSRLSEWLKVGPGSTPGRHNLPARSPGYLKKQG